MASKTALNTKTPEIKNKTIDTIGFITISEFNILTKKVKMEDAKMEKAKQPLQVKVRQMFPI